MSARYFIVRGVDELGPYSVSELKTLAATDRLTRSDGLRRTDQDAVISANRARNLWPAPMEDVHFAELAPPPLPVFNSTVPTAPPPLPTVMNDDSKVMRALEGVHASVALYFLCRWHMGWLGLAIPVQVGCTVQLCRALHWSLRSTLWTGVGVAVPGLNLIVLLWLTRRTQRALRNGSKRIDARGI